ncbi:E3 ubiquitin-protein ligase FANCL-like isoform X2 [Pollicipes pollicipes]|uniref:E3 ubiquitin-protein ligase FANCL-like isoform X2 n=1 Tax=Pollicipes pollicipes TaxID=41117 RepID=UPI001884C787|nr:E3 ubiquitin-protein ligase FANCL-like isoform X2 [Pollicipes pollicipes]
MIWKYSEAAMDEPCLFTDFPLLVRLKTTVGLVLRGHIQAQGRWWPVTVLAPHYPDLKQLQDVGSCSTLHEAIATYRSSLECLPPPPPGGATADGDDAAVIALRSHVAVLRQLRQIGLHHVTWASTDLSQVTLSTLDRAARRHQLSLTIGADYPGVCPRLATDLPADLAVTWHRGMGLLDLFQRFEEAVERYQAFWNALDAVDAELWVVDPERPARRDQRRRLVISGQLSLEVTVEPLYPTAVPGCRFLGAEAAAAELRERLASKIDSWDEYEGVVDNLERLLGVEFVRRGAAGAAGAISVECGICYCYRMAEETPSRCCDDSRCGQPFHNSCLYEWLRALPSTRQTLRTVFGDCPYCSTPISCEIPSG